MKFSAFPWYVYALIVVVVIGYFLIKWAIDALFDWIDRKFGKKKHEHRI